MSLKISEDRFQAQVTQLAEILGWSWMHVIPLRTAHGWRVGTTGPLAKGWPDLFLSRTRRPRSLFAELKALGEPVSTDQKNVHDILRRAGFEVCVWWPQDWEEIQEVLKA